MVSHPELTSEEMLDAGTFNFLRNRHSMLSLVENVTDEIGMIPDLVLDEKQWHALSIPTTVLWGEKDIFGSPKLGQEVAAQVPAGKCVIIPDSGHLPWMDAPELVATEIIKAVCSA